MERLDEYRKKRDFERTAEPAGDEPVAAGERRYVMQKHAASRLHYDLRLEHEGVLLSWALPKGPSLEPGEKRLAVHVEDHPLEYGDFEGTIPAGEYGGGTVMLWDRGRWEPVGKGVQDDRIDFALEGEKLRGTWTLTKTSGRGGRDEDNWLLIKRTDPNAPPLEPGETSVLTGRTMEEIAEGVEASDILPTRETGVTPAGEEVPEAGDLEGARRRSPPDEPEPQLATLTDAAPEGDAWLHEIKFDGYRVLAFTEGENVRLTTRNGHDWTDRFPEVADALRHVPAERALLDGEVVVLGEDGVSSFRALQEALSSGDTSRLTYQAFDLLHLDDHDLRDVAQLARKEVLSQLLAATGTALAGRVRYTDHVRGQGAEVFERACEMGLEGTIAKRVDAPYRGGRGKRWLKVKCGRTDEFVVGGFTPPKGSREGFGSLLLGAFEGDGLAYAGRVGTGFDDRLLRQLFDRLQDMERSSSPFVGDVPDAKGATWVEPELVVDVAFTERTRDGRLRHPTFRGVREDKPAAEVRAETTETPLAAPRAKRATGKKAKPSDGSRLKKGEAAVAGVRLTNPDRVLYPQQGITKRDLAEYYVDVEEHVLPGIVDRPLSLVRCPEGRAKQCFYQKHPGESFPSDLPTVPIEEKSGTRAYAYVRTIADLVGLVQAGVLEVHIWGSRIDQLERPDLMVIDLDPSPDVDWAVTRATAIDLHDRLEGLGLQGFLRTTGGKGLHVVVPLVRRQGWDEVKGFARAVCESHAADDRENLTTNASKAKRGGKIYLDYLRNGRGATAIASFSTRAREGAPVAVPLRWDELDASLRSDRYRVDNVRRRLAALRDDPWAGYDEAARTITAAMRKAVGMR
jgi:bifunctional non-homologous end joining protein LigD